MGLRARILRIVKPESGGERKKTVLRGLARTPAQVRRFEGVFKKMLAQGELVMRGTKRGAMYGLPRRRA